ncbi:MAG: hypothetical protein L6Q66_02600 [Bacteroidia bacterium]|nr:hypothetical protein [Bacteroidia bacterium]
MDLIKEELSIEIARDKTKVVLISSLAIIMGVASFVMWFRADTSSHYPVVYVKFLSVSGVILFLGAGLFGIKKIFDQKPALLLTPEGIVNNSNIITFDLVKWKDIEKFESYSVKRTKMILIYVTNPDDYITRSKGIAKFFMNLNYRFHKTPLSITPNVLNCAFDDLLETLNYKLEKYKNKG